MKKTILFDDKIRSMEGPADYNADIYTYYNESAKPEMDNVRRLKYFARIQ